MYNSRNVCDFKLGFKDMKKKMQRIEFSSRDRIDLELDFNNMYLDPCFRGPRKK